MGGLIGASAEMQRVYKSLRTTHANNLPVLITGEIGTEKETVARCVHSLGPRKQKPFVSVDCSAPEPFVEFKLLGSRRETVFGAFEKEVGLLGKAAGGSLFLNEISRLSFKTQRKLSEVLLNEQFYPFNSTRPVAFTARVIATTRDDLVETERMGVLREDLYSYLSAIWIELPPLRERRGDIPLLLDYFTEKYAPHRAEVEFSRDTMSYLLAYDWPGNICEFADTVKRALSVAGTVVSPADLGLNLRDLAEPAGIQSDFELERSAIDLALHETGGDIDTAGQILGIDPLVLRKRVKHYYGSLPDWL
jgi:DNA-binding NtrC family response regulator